MVWVEPCGKGYGVELVVVVAFGPCPASEAPVERLSAERIKPPGCRWSAEPSLHRDARREFRAYNGQAYWLKIPRGRIQCLACVGI